MSKSENGPPRHERSLRRAARHSAARAVQCGVVRGGGWEVMVGFEGCCVVALRHLAARRSSKPRGEAEGGWGWGNGETGARSGHGAPLTG